jgi:hypothetical protein
LHRQTVPGGTIIRQATELAHKKNQSGTETAR